MLSGEEEKLYSKRNAHWEQLPPSSASCITLDMFYITTEYIITAATDFISCEKKKRKKKYCVHFGLFILTAIWVKSTDQ